MVSAINFHGCQRAEQLNEQCKYQQHADCMSFRGGAYERVPEYDTYEKKKNGGAVFAGIVGILGVGSAIWAYTRGKKVDGNIFNKLGEGYKDIWKMTSNWFKEHIHFSKKS